MAFVQYGTTTVVAVSRMTLLYFPRVFGKKWYSYSWIVMILLCLLPLFVTYPIFLHDAFFQYNATLDRYSLESEYPSFILFSSLFMFMCACSGITIVANFVTFCKIRKLWIKPQNLETSYALVVLAASVIQIVGTFLTYAMQVATPNTYLFRMTNVILPFVSDALTLIQPFLLIIFCNGVRKRVGEYFLCFNCCISTSVSQVAVATIT